MARKVFISVLGSSPYKECVYVDKNMDYKSKPVRFIQEAILEKTAQNWSENDAFLIFVTDGKNGSLEKNWKDTEAEGLETRIKKLNLPPGFSEHRIPEGNNTEEIWKIFEIIYSKLKPNDYLYIDITHGYRYLPMLVVVLANYAKFLNNIQIDNITYGNYEGRDKQTGEAPIVNLTSFSTLQDWTNAVNEFIKSGSTNALTPLLLNEANNTKGAARQTLQKFEKSIRNFTNSISTVRGEEIYNSINIKKIREEIKQVRKKIELTPLVPVLNKLEEKIKEFRNDYSKENGETAIQWCLDHNLVQQAYTLGQEHIISIICDRFELNYRKKDDREFVSSAIGYMNQLEKKPNSDLYENLKERQEKYKSIAGDASIKKIFKNFGSLSSMRNTLNHGGMLGTVDAKGIMNSFEKFYYPIIEELKEN